MAEVNAAMPKPASAPNTNVSAQAVNPNSGDPSKATNAHRVVNAPFQIKPFHSVERWIKMIVYGRHGAGKTELFATAVDVPEMCDVLLISAESGSMTIADSPRIKNPEGIFEIKVTTFKAVAQINEFLTAYCAARDRNDEVKMKQLYSQVSGIPLAEIPVAPRFRTVILDSLTEIEVYCTYGILGIDSEKVIHEDIDTAGWPEFRKNNEMVKLLVRAFRNLPMHVLMTCAEQYTQDEQKRHHYTPALTGKLSAQVQGFVDIVGWITVGAVPEGQIEAARRVYIQPISSGPKFDAKNRRSVYPHPYFDNPSMASIMKDIKLLK